MIGKLVGHYRVLEKIGAGGMGEVFRARDERLGRDVALKLIRPASSGNPEHLRRFEQEARAAAALNHPNILAIYDVGFEGDNPYIVSELLEGETLRARLAQGPIPMRQAAGYAVQIAQGLSVAHERRIVHRDLKPENLFLTQDDRIKILDFGVAKLQASPEDDRGIESLTTVTKHGAVIGTVAYMSPEQLRGKTVDHRSDIFSFGAILYEMLAGQRAFRGETEVDTMTAVLREEPAVIKLDEASIPGGYQDVVRHCLEKEPENRFQSARDLVFALQTLSGSVGVRTADMSPVKEKPATVVPWVIVAALAITTVALAITQLLHTPVQAPAYRRLTFESGTIYSARFTADGQSVVYGAAWNDKPVQLFSTVGNSVLSQPLQFSDAILLGISRNNDLALAVGGTRTGQLETMNGMLADAPLAGGAPREVLSDVRWADWNPKGDLAVVHYVEGHSRLEYPIGHVLYESGGWISNIRFSPRGDQIAFMDHPALFDNRGAISVVDLSGHLRILCSSWESESGLAWRPDGKEIWFTAVAKGTNLNLMAVDLAARVRSLLDVPMGMVLEDVAPDGRALIALRSSRLAMGFKHIGDKDIDISWHDWNSARDMSADGKSVLFEDASEAAGPNYAVVVRRVDGGLPIRLGDGSSGGLSPDGKWAASVSTHEAPQITLLPIGPGQPRSIPVTGLRHLHSGWARFLPNGQELVIAGDETGHGARCYAVNLDNGHARPVTPEGIACGPISADGSFIVGKGSPEGTSAFPLNGGAPKTLLAKKTTLNPVQWSEDGASLYGYHVGEFPSKVYALKIATGQETPIEELKPGAPSGVVMVAPVVVSRDGKSFAYSYNQTLSVLYLVTGLH